MNTESFYGCSNKLRKRVNNMIDVSNIKIITAKDKIIDVVKKLELMILEEIDRICRKNGIEYSICGGTMLGAIRHGGFIPWDDDIDINFTPEEYDRFLEACKTDLDNERFTLLTHETCPNFNEYPSKILLKDTMCRSMSAKKADIPLTICVDLFRLDSMPNDEKTRLEVFHKLQVQRQLLYCISYDNITFLQDEKDRTKKNEFIMKHGNREKIIKKLRKYEKQINEKYKGSRYQLETWIYNTSNFFLEDVLEGGYEDVPFEDITVRKFKRHHQYLVNHYGEDHMLMPPPEKRVSHHRFIEFDLGKYAKEYNLPENYEKYMLTDQKLDGERLLQIKKLCLEMLDELDRICKKHGIKYYMSGDDLLFKASGIEEFSKLYRNPVCVFMDRNNLKKFDAVAKEELSRKFFYQTRDTDKEYAYWYPKIRYNGTFLRDRTLFGADIHNGVWINIGLIVNTPEDKDEAKKYYDELRQMNEDMKYKFLYDDERVSEMKRNLKELKNDQKAFDEEKKKIDRIEYLKKYSLEEMLEKQDALIDRYEDMETPYVVEISTNMTKAVQMKKSDIGDGVRDTLLGHEYTFPKDMKGITSAVTDFIPQRGKRYERLKNVKENEPEKYRIATEEGGKKFLRQMNEKHRAFDLGKFDAPNYTLSVFYFEGEEP